ncbi:threonylcarbamoyl-AMP synthase [Candidatus Bathyarchaeota archaeon]|nr:threonylcarbamoyl-AMP synthase [Candidatus Bathyarchaeota archaeon]
MTVICRVDPLEPDRSILRRAAEIVRQGGLVAFPTETVYGLGANALDPAAVKKIFHAKGRPLDNPLIVHVASIDQIYMLAKRIPREAEALIERFFPGPLTIVLEKEPIVPDETTASLPTVAVRMPDHKVASRLIEESGIPIAAPSANKAGRPSPTRAQHVLQDLEGEVDMIIDGGATRLGLESTVVDLTVNPPELLRPGAVTFEMLRKVVRTVQVHPSVLQDVSYGGAVRSPGMKYRHYAPRAELIVVVGDQQNVQMKIEQLIRELSPKKLRIGVARTTGKLYNASHLEELGRSKQEIARDLFDVLRRFDEANVDVIFAEGIDERGLGLAIMNRLKKASGYKIIRA